jgi:hypothetical protein
VSFSFPRLTPLFVLVLASLSALPARAQFSGAGGVTAPAVIPPPVLSYGGFGGYGGHGGWGGWGTQWMQNPYEGYLNGAANITTANAQYQLTIQQAKQAREEARRSSLQTRRASIEERQYELSLMPDPEQIRQDQMRRSLERSRRNPPSTDIWSGTALNDLLRDIQDAHTRGVNGPDISLSPDVLQHINLTTGVTYGGAGLLKNGGKLSWPYVLRRSTFNEDRKKIDGQVQEAVKQAQSGEVSADLLDTIGVSLKRLEGSINARVEDITPTEYVQASRYLRELKQSYKVLQQNDVAKYFRPAWSAQGTTVAELVRQMTKQGQRFGPAVSGDESFYTSLHRSMVDYDMGLGQLRTMAPSP